MRQPGANDGSAPCQGEAACRTLVPAGKRYCPDCALIARDAERDAATEVGQ